MLAHLVNSVHWFPLHSFLHHFSMSVENVFIHAETSENELNSSQVVWLCLKVQVAREGFNPYSRPDVATARGLSRVPPLLAPSARTLWY